MSPEVEQLLHAARTVLALYDRYEHWSHDLLENNFSNINSLRFYH
jgi:hypothetical protein